LIDDSQIELTDGRRMDLTWMTYPISSDRQAMLIGLWRTEWSHTDFDWLEAMNGDYAETLVIESLIGQVGGRPAGSASVYYPASDPEVCLVGNVITHPDFRRLQIARQLTERVVGHAFDAGCKVAYLGTTRSERCVYLNCGFDWVSGGVMRRPHADGSEGEVQFYTPAQQTRTREACWGDMPGLACLVAQPLESLVLDYAQGLVSPRYAAMSRCVSNFPVIWYDVQQRGGNMRVLVGEKAHRILGFGSVTLGPGSIRKHTASVDLCLHDQYQAAAPPLIDELVAEAKSSGVEFLYAHVAAIDRTKLQWLEAAGFRKVAELANDLQLDANQIDTLVLKREPV
jgi:GNAT superfamily N-acetyltransferase